MRIEVRLDEPGLERLLTGLGGRAERAQALRPALHDIADDFYDIERRRFAAGMAHWKPLSPEWAIRKARGGRSTVPLAGGDLEKSLTSKGRRFSVRRITSTSLFVGTNNPVANLHSSGSKTGRLPKRPPVAISPIDRARWGKILLRHVSGQRRGVGL